MQFGETGLCQRDVLVYSDGGGGGDDEVLGTYHVDVQVSKIRNTQLNKIK